GEVVHVEDEALDEAGEEVEEDGGRDRDRETDGGVDERLGDAGADDVHAATAGQLAERIDDADDRAEEADERRRRGHRRQAAEAAAQVRRLALLHALERAVDRVDDVEVADLLGTLGLERVEAVAVLGEPRLHHLGDRAPLVALRRRDRPLDVAALAVLAERDDVVEGLLAAIIEADRPLDDDREHEHAHEDHEHGEPLPEETHRVPHLDDVESVHVLLLLASLDRRSGHHSSTFWNKYGAHAGTACPLTR